MSTAISGVEATIQPPKSSGLYPLRCCCSIAASYCLPVRFAYLPGRWVVFRYETAAGPYPDDDLVKAHRDLLDRLAAGNRRDGLPFLLGPDGRPDGRVNAFFSSSRMRGRSPLTWKKYAYALGVWLNFLEVIGRRWDDVQEEDAEFFKEWRLTDQANPRPVEASTFAGDLAALRSFYRWAARVYHIVDPVAASGDLNLRPHGVRDRDIKWFDPAGYRRWRDLGLRGLGVDDRLDPRWRGRNDQRDVAFADGLYGSGLRLAEWASVLLTELPDDEPGRGYATAHLADVCAKGGYGHKYWLPRTALLGVLDYVEGARAKAVRRAQRCGRYVSVPRQRLVLGRQGDRLHLQEPDGGQRLVALNAIAPRDRARLFRATPEGVEPVALWLNEDGMPRAAHGWQHTFAAANARIARLGLSGFSGTPHMLRHSCALRWYAVGRLAYERRFAHLDVEEQRDFRVQFGNTWDLVATMLGHRSPETTRQHYLEPFRTLELDLLVHHAQQASVDGFLTGYLADHPLVRTDPIGGPR
jgi:site-specific recombinase XerD